MLIPARQKTISHTSLARSALDPYSADTAKISNGSNVQCPFLWNCRSRYPHSPKRVIPYKHLAGIIIIIPLASSHKHCLDPLRIAVFLVQAIFHRIYPLLEYRRCKIREENVVFPPYIPPSVLTQAYNLSTWTLFPRYPS